MCVSHAGRRIGCDIRFGRWLDDAGGNKLIAVIDRQSRSAYLATHCTDGALSTVRLTLLPSLFSLLFLTLPSLVPDDGEGRHG